MSKETNMYKPVNAVRIVTASSLFDGHDAAINIMRRIIQSAGVEVIHLGHNRSVDEIVEAAIHEDAQAIAITSYQGGHMEFFRYMKKKLDEAGSGHIRIFGGGGGVILPEEIYDLEKFGITKIFSPDDGRVMGLNGMISYLVEECDFARGDKVHPVGDIRSDYRFLAESISSIENYPELINPLIKGFQADKECKLPPVLGVTGTGGAGKSSLVDELVRRFKLVKSDLRICILSVDPTKRKTGGALLGDRIRMNSIHQPGVFMRSLATRQSHVSLPAYIDKILCLAGLYGFDLIILETSGIGQSDTEITDFSDLSLYVMTPEYGAATQLEKIDMLDYADVVALNKFDKRGADDALRDVSKQFQRNHKLFEKDIDDMPVYGTIASQFNDPGVNELFNVLVQGIAKHTTFKLSSKEVLPSSLEKMQIIPARKIRYLAEITDTVRKYNEWTEEQAGIAEELYALKKSGELLSDKSEIELVYRERLHELDKENLEIIQNWEQKKAVYGRSVYSYEVRKKVLEVQTKTESLSHLMIPKVCLPKFTGWGNILKWVLQENVPGEFPYAAGVFPFKREAEDPTRMFAGEGGPERTNKRFHYLSNGLSAKRLSTAYDSVTLYGEDPDHRPDIYGKVGNSGVSICTLDDSK
ncbi:MAG: methylmalonyl-CoA mutase family protein, partial [Bacteroidales bacterium]|nr:methylmalonyl-CoA mutase family protein [Bacteroidales bacterium]